MPGRPNASTFVAVSRNPRVARVSRLLRDRGRERPRVVLRRTAQQRSGWPLPAGLTTRRSTSGCSFALTGTGRCGPTARTSTASSSATASPLQLLCEEYARVHPDGYRRSQFCEIYRQWVRRLRPSTRQVHPAADKTFLDFSGKRPALVDPRTGEVRRLELFVAPLGASSFTYAEPAATQQLPDWVGAHTRMVEYFGDTTAL